MTWFLTGLRAIPDNRGGPMSMAKSLPIGPMKRIGKGFPEVLDFPSCPIAENGKALTIREARRASSCFPLAIVSVRSCVGRAAGRFRGKRPSATGGERWYRAASNGPSPYPLTATSVIFS
jgi:hypothetical protein